MDQTIEHEHVSTMEVDHKTYKNLSESSGGNSPNKGEMNESDGPPPLDDITDSDDSDGTSSGSDEPPPLEDITDSDDYSEGASSDSDCGCDDDKCSGVEILLLVMVIVLVCVIGFGALIS